MDLLTKDKIKFQYYDPFIKEFDYNSKIKSTNLSLIKKSIIVSIIITDHDKIKFEYIKILKIYYRY